MAELSLLWFVSEAKGLDHIAENILAYLDAKSLCAAELVCKEWYRVISEGNLWKKLIERKVLTDSQWKGLSERRSWYEVTTFSHGVMRLHSYSGALLRTVINSLVK